MGARTRNGTRKRELEIDERSGSDARQDTSDFPERHPCDRGPVSDVVDLHHNRMGLDGGAMEGQPIVICRGNARSCASGALVACAICISLFRFAYGRKTGEKTGHPFPDETMDAFRKICGTCYYDENLNAIEPLIFSLDDEKLSVLGLSV